MSPLELAVAVLLVSVVFWAKVILQRLERLGAAAQGTEGMQTSGPFLAVGQPAPPFELLDVRSGESRGSDELLKVPTLLILFSPRCPTCQREIGGWMEQRRRWRAEGLAVVFVAVEEPSHRDKVREFIDRHDPTQPVYLAEPSSRFVRSYDRLLRLPAFYTLLDGQVSFAGEIGQEAWTSFLAELDSLRRRRIEAARKFA